MHRHEFFFFFISGPFVEIHPSSTLWMIPSILLIGQPKCLSLWWGFCCVARFREVFSFSRATLLFFGFFLFFHLNLFDDIRFQYTRVLVSFFFSKRSDFSWFGSSLPSVICYFPLSIISMVHFSMPKSILISWLYSSQLVPELPILFHFYQTAWYRPCTWGG